MLKKIVTGVLAFIGVMLGIWLLTNVFSNEPRYRGKTVSAWFKEYYRSSWSASRSLVVIGGTPTGVWQFMGNDSPIHQAAREALQALGTNAVPYLLTEYYSTATDGFFRTNLYRWGYHLPQRWRPGIYIPRELIRAQASVALGDIHPPGDFVVPLLTNRLNGRNAQDRIRTVELLCTMGCGTNEAMPFLQEMLRSPNATDQNHALSLLLQSGYVPTPALTNLVALIEDESRNDQIGPTCILVGRCGAVGSNAVPALQKRLASTLDPLARLELAKTLCQIDSQQTNALQVILNVVADRSNTYRQIAIKDVGEIGKNAKAAAPLLFQVTGESNEYTSGPAITNLLYLGETNLAVAGMAGKLKGDNQRSQLRAISFILEHDPTNSLAISNLVALIRHEAWGGVAITACAEFGNVPDEVTSAIREIASDDKAYYQWQAKNALRAIGAGNTRHELH